MISKKIYTFNYSGQWLSLNKVYSTNRYLRSEEKRKYKEVFKTMIQEQDIEPFSQFEIELVYNSRMDCENTSAGLKVFVDCLRELGLVPNDDKRFYTGLTIIPDLTLKHNQYIISLITRINDEEINDKKN